MASRLLADDPVQLVLRVLQSSHYVSVIADAVQPCLLRFRHVDRAESSVNQYESAGDIVAIEVRACDHSLVVDAAHRGRSGAGKVNLGEGAFAQQKSVVHPSEE